MPVTGAPKAGGSVPSLSPKKGTARPPHPTKPGPSSMATGHSGTPTNATAKGSRRAQGWHSAVGGGSTASLGVTGELQPTLDSKDSMHSRANGGVPRRSSVQFSADALDNTSKPRPSAPNKDDAAFRQSMADFLTVMYGDRTSGSSTSAAGGGGDSGGTSVASKGKGEGAGNSGADKGDTSKAQRSGSPNLPLPGAKGPLVKGLTANGSRQTTGDRIDTLVDTLVRAYSRQATSSRGDFHGTTGGPDDDNPISYNRPRPQNYRRAVASSRQGQGGGRSGIDADEVSLFVSQAMDSFIGPGGLRQHGLPSTRSVLSSLGVDKNVFGLISFQTRSNMQDVDAVEDESDTKLEPMYVGEQAMFKSVGTRPNVNDISISKSMRGVMPAPAELTAELAKESGSGNSVVSQCRVSSAARTRRFSGGPPQGRLNNSNMSLDSGAAGGGGSGKLDGSGTRQDGEGGRQISPRRRSAGGGAHPRVSLCMSLDSKALGNGAANDDDDNWGNDTTALPTVLAPVVVSSARSLLDFSKTRHSAATEAALSELMEEEQLKRGVVMAVERQLRGYVVSLEAEEGTKKKGARGSAVSSRRCTTESAPSMASTVASGSVGARAPRNSSTSRRPSADGNGSGSGGDHNPVNTAATPPMKNTVEFFEKQSKQPPPHETMKRLAK
ncbi:hypothetical protein ABB37_09526 [Leptomonas pyrrhocoris]|uniref:Uncharacterized protein n=1 Tax=Leptomonas pyrrhocoris TaxID=157538 RepID=A0A0N0DRC3_LEPPY|nr:hypothetical protein ABB37_09526 [Leptomonas pyrrhocoris]KPA73931.1 hypothetical protein ABB37_09526 [Leptomonas pyrrhocoris]|eukprot:XP_015652370.1 hypothetical protein ABB37_09526 [Leptomonas pyrrhocoris]